MAIAKITNQFYTTGGRQLDAKTQPLNSINELSSIIVKDRYEGMTVIVLNDNYDEEEELISSCPMECWLVGGTTNACWRIKSFSAIPTYADLESYTSTIFAKFKKMIAVGTEATVLKDETHGNKLTKYWVVSNDEAAIVWDTMIKGDGDYVPTNCVSGSDIENN